MSFDERRNLIGCKMLNDASENVADDLCLRFKVLLRTAATYDERQELLFDLRAVLRSDEYDMRWEERDFLAFFAGLLRVDSHGRGGEEQLLSPAENVGGVGLCYGFVNSDKKTGRSFPWRFLFDDGHCLKEVVPIFQGH